jgi:hypothetical protein
MYLFQMRANRFPEEALGIISLDRIPDCAAGDYADLQVVVIATF